MILASALALASAQEPAPAAQGPDGMIQLPARQVTIHGTTVRYEPQPHKNTIGYWTKAADWVSWDFKLTQPGTFTVTLTQACGKGSGGSEYRLSVGEQALTNTVADTGAFANFVERVIGTVNLAHPGDYTLSVRPINKPGLAVMDLRAVTLKLQK